ncbi:PREDICTED: phenolic glucoside malonyltransferase 1-like isoform X2 [Camelina sativa]|uniref:Phenolic glucoside malonyltransferase 1-like isoform X1 n=2 Tax=Camelina sativa TaxID=90675 RepID=A0ABM1QH88_CAMSA|nr:PREDICTED: phenolic glucoside malonyltransferase 1-like isoform X1 [Camelina sativa]XP_019086126.1 PREDICTED: phenolic glucoside malonyltransferase 1-like isoform X2 [Camelina sativa]
MSGSVVLFPSIVQEMDSSVNIINVERVSPSISDSSESLTLPLTFFDLLWFKHHPVERVIFFRLTEATRSFFDSAIVPNLKASLSSSLSHYLPLAGKLVWEPLDLKPSIVYSPNDAVSFTVAESNADFSRLTGKEPFFSTELHPLVPELQSSDDSASVMSFQVTLFPNQGFCVGVTAHHGVLDGKTTTSFLKSWAHICKHQDSSLPKDLTPFYDRTVIKGPPNGDIKVLNSWQTLVKTFMGGKEPENPKSLKLPPSPVISPDAVRYTLELTPEDIQTFRERLKRESFPLSKVLRLSTFVITYSYALTCLFRARGGDPNEPVGFVFAADCRKIVTPPIPSSYFGNCAVSTYRIPLTADTFMGEEGFLASARLVSGLAEELEESVVWNIPDYVEFFSSIPLGTKIVSVAGSTRFSVYGMDFGWGRPEKVVVVSIDQGEAISLAENRDRKGGVEVGFSLKKHEMDALIDLLHNGLKV